MFLVNVEINIFNHKKKTHYIWLKKHIQFVGLVGKIYQKPMVHLTNKLTFLFENVINTKNERKYEEAASLNLYLFGKLQHIFAK
jgi:hypothetical protein